MAKKGTVKVVKDPDTRVVICDERKKPGKMIILIIMLRNVGGHWLCV